MRAKLLAYFNRFKTLQGSPEYLAKGLAIGVFVGVAPVMPLKTALIFTLTLIFSGSMVAGLLSCTLICNPFTYLPLYYFAWRVGDFLLPDRASWEQLKAFIHLMGQAGLPESLMLAAQVGLDTALVVLAGGMILALPFGIVSYPFAYRLFATLTKEKK